MDSNNISTVLIHNLKSAGPIKIWNVILSSLDNLLKDAYGQIQKQCVRQVLGCN